MKRFALSAVAALAVVALAGSNSMAAKPLQSIGISVGDLANPYFVAIGQGAEETAKKLGGPNVKVTTVSSKYDLNTQVGQIEDFIANKTDIILVNAVDPKGIAPVLKKARDAGVIVVAVDVGAQGADATVMSDNVAAGTNSCQYLAKHLDGKGNVVIINGPPVTAVIDRVTGCKKALASYKDIKILSDNQNANGSRDGSLTVMENLLTANAKIDGVFSINDPSGIGAELAVKQAHRSDIKLITSVDGNPDAEAALKEKDSLFAATAAEPVSDGVAGGPRRIRPFARQNARAKSYAAAGAPRDEGQYRQLSGLGAQIRIPFSASIRVASGGGKGKRWRA